MSKKTPNQIREELRRQMAKAHNDEIENLKKLKLHNWELFVQADKKCQELERENDELKEKVRQYEDWNRRLMEFMDMNDEQREEALAEYKVNADLSALMDVYGKIFYTIFPTC